MERDSGKNDKKRAREPTSNKRRGKRAQDDLVLGQRDLDNDDGDRAAVKKPRPKRRQPHAAGATLLRDLSVDALLCVCNLLSLADMGRLLMTQKSTLERTPLLASKLERVVSLRRTVDLTHHLADTVGLRRMVAKHKSLIDLSIFNFQSWALEDMDNDARLKLQRLQVEHVLLPTIWPYIRTLSNLTSLRFTNYRLYQEEINNIGNNLLNLRSLTCKVSDEKIDFGCLQSLNHLRLLYNYVSYSSVENLSTIVALPPALEELDIISDLYGDGLWVIGYEMDPNASVWQSILSLLPRSLHTFRFPFLRMTRPPSAYFGERWYDAGSALKSVVMGFMRNLPDQNPNCKPPVDEWMKRGHEWHSIRNDIEACTPIDTLPPYTLLTQCDDETSKWASTISLARYCFQRNNVDVARRLLYRGLHSVKIPYPAHIEFFRWLLSDVQYYESSMSCHWLGVLAFELQRMGVSYPDGDNFNRSGLFVKMALDDLFDIGTNESLRMVRRVTTALYILGATPKSKQKKRRGMQVLKLINSYGFDESAFLAKASTRAICYVRSRLREAYQSSISTAEVHHLLDGAFNGTLGVTPKVASHERW